MYRLFKVVLNKIRGQFVLGGKLTKSHSKTKSALLGIALLVGVFSTGSVMAGEKNSSWSGQYFSGSAKLSDEHISAYTSDENSLNSKRDDNGKNDGEYVTFKKDRKSTVAKKNFSYKSLTFNGIGLLILLCIILKVAIRIGFIRYK